MSEHTFPSFEAFHQWKNDEEVRTNSSYTLQSGSRVRQQTRFWYYYCNRSGEYEPKGEDIQSLKLQGTNKLGVYCTAHMTVWQTSTGVIDVTYCSTHFNHCNELAHVNLPEPVRMKVAAKLQQGVSINRIQNEIRESVHGNMNRVEST